MEQERSAADRYRIMVIYSETSEARDMVNFVRLFVRKHDCNREITKNKNRRWRRVGRPDYNRLVTGSGASRNINTRLKK